MGEYPEGYDVAKAAVYFGIHPQEALVMPSYWIELAGIISTAENSVQERAHAKQAAKARKR